MLTCVSVRFVAAQRSCFSRSLGYGLSRLSRHHLVRYSLTSVGRSGFFFGGPSWKPFRFEPGGGSTPRVRVRVGVRVRVRVRLGVRGGVSVRARVRGMVPGLQHGDPLLSQKIHGHDPSVRVNHG